MRKSKAGSWLSQLDPSERIVANVAITAFEEIVLPMQMTGGCYYFAFFLREFLKVEYGIQVEMVVGWLDDKPLPVSHAWIEYNGKKTDISLGAVMKSNGNFSAPVIIHDIGYRTGGDDYSYLRVVSHPARMAHAAAANDPNYGPIYKEQETTRREIKDWLKTPTGTAEFFARAEDPILRYEILAMFLKNALVDVGS